jgi:hypothetical protein
MQTSRLLLLFPFASFLSLPFALFSRAEPENVQTPQVLARVLNSITAVTTTTGEQLKTSCLELQQALPELAQAAPAEQNSWRELLTSGQTSWDLFCSPREDATNPLSQLDPQVWQGAPYCLQGGRPTYRCSYNHNRGRGLFIYERPSAPILDNFLVCALSAGESSGPFASGYSITNRCVVSSLDWYAYVRLDPVMSIRSDVKGVLRWENGKARTQPIKLPKFLYDQCSTAFKESFFCTPALVVLPTTQSDTVDVCGLHSKRTSIGISFLSISSASSKWSCERMNLREVSPQSQTLSVKESQCIPDFTGAVDSSCDLPYLPRTQYPIRVKEEPSL